MIVTKSAREITLMADAGKILVEVFAVLDEFVRVGVTTAQLDEVCVKVIKKHHAEAAFLGYRGYPASVCTSVNEVLIHGIPNHKQVLKEGDIISVDVGVVYKGYYSDAARSYALGQVKSELKQLLEVTQDSFFRCLEYAKPESHLGSLCWAIGDYVASYGYKVPQEYTGHGIGSSLHEMPSIPNYGIKDTGILLKPGMTLAIEPMVMMGSGKTHTKADDWTVVTVDHSYCAHYENTIVITENGYEILTI